MKTQFQFTSEALELGLIEKLFHLIEPGCVLRIVKYEIVPLFLLQNPNFLVSLYTCRFSNLTKLV